MSQSSTLELERAGKTTAREIRSSIPQTHTQPSAKQLQQLSQQYNDASAAIELFEVAATATTTTGACRAIAEKLQAHLACERVVVGVRKSKRCIASAISDIAEIDRDSEAIERFEAALDESIVRGSISAWPPLPGTSPHQLLAHRQLAGRERMIVSLPLRIGTPDGDGKTIVGAVTVIGARNANSIERLGNFMTAVSDGIAIAIATAQKSEGGPVRRRLTTICHPKHATRCRIIAAAATLITAAMFMPIPYKIRCAAIAEPSERRFCVAPTRRAANDNDGTSRRHR